MNDPTISDAKKAILKAIIDSANNNLPNVSARDIVDMSEALCRLSSLERPKYEPS